MGKLRVQTLEWGDAESIDTTNPPFDLIIGSDILYDNSYLHKLVGTDKLMETVTKLSGPSTEIRMAAAFDWHELEDRCRRHGFQAKDLSQEQPAASIIAEIGPDRAPIHII